jgi:hypothetical protein
MAQLIKIVRDWCQTCHRGYATCTLIGADRRMIGRYCHQCGERALRKANREEQRQSMAQEESKTIFGGVATCQSGLMISLMTYPRRDACAFGGISSTNPSPRSWIPRRRHDTIWRLCGGTSMRRRWMTHSKAVKSPRACPRPRLTRRFRHNPPSLDKTSSRLIAPR